MMFERFCEGPVFRAPHSGQRSRNGNKEGASSSCWPGFSAPTILRAVPKVSVSRVDQVKTGGHNSFIDRFYGSCENQEDFTEHGCFVNDHMISRIFVSRSESILFRCVAIFYS